MFEVRQYLASDGTNPFLAWLKKLKDPKAKIAVIRRLNRLEDGNFGDHKSVGDGVWELRINTGPGYRVYYAKEDNLIVLLLCAGSKSDQSDDIDDAKTYWADWHERKRKGNA